MIRPALTSITGAGTTTVTVNWTNGFSALSYVLQYSTNITPSIPTNWFNVLPPTLGGTSGSKTDNPPAGTSKRFYRVYGLYP